MVLGRPYGCEGATDTSASHATEMGIHLNEGTFDPEHRPTQSAGSFDRIRDCPRIGTSPCPESRQIVQKFHVGVPPRLGGAAGPFGVAGLKIEAFNCRLFVFE